MKMPIRLTTLLLLSRCRPTLRQRNGLTCHPRGMGAPPMDSTLPTAIPRYTIGSIRRRLRAKTMGPQYPTGTWWTRLTLERTRIFFGWPGARLILPTAMPKSIWTFQIPALEGLRGVSADNEVMNRREFIQGTSAAAASVMLASLGRAEEEGYPVVRTAEAQRKFTSAAVEGTIQRIQSSMGNKELAWMFGNCFPNTLDTTVDFEMAQGQPDTYVITGDIDAMWLRDSSAQVWPYLPLIKADFRLQQLIAGVINRQTRCILLDPYANAFYKDEHKISQWQSDHTEMKPGVHERKWEVDSLCYPIRLAYGYWKNAGDSEPFNSSWRQAVLRIVETFRDQQRKTGKGRYSFQRRTETATDTLPGGGYGRPAKPVGLICSMFRPSDDATVFPYLVPSNFFAVVSLRQAAEMLEAILHDSKSAGQCRALANEVEEALRQYAVVNHARFG